MKTCKAYQIPFSDLVEIFAYLNKGKEENKRDLTAYLEDTNEASQTPPAQEEVPDGGVPIWLH